MAISEFLIALRKKIGHDLLLLPSVAAIIRDDRGRVLLQKTVEGLWSLPAGAIEPGETPAAAVAREVWEETGLVVRPVRIEGVFGGGDLRVTYLNGDVVEYTVIVFECETLGGELKARDDETAELAFFTPEEMPKLSVQYPRTLFSHTSDLADFEWNEDWLATLK